MVASDDAVIAGVNVGRYLQTYSKRDLGPRVRLRLRPATATARPWCAAASASSGTSRPAARRRRRRRTRRSCSRRRSRRSRPPTASNLLLKDGLPPPPGVRPVTAGRPARRARSSTSTSATPTRGSGTSTSSARWHRTTWSRSRYVGSQGRQMLLKGDPNQAPPVVGVSDSNVNRPYAALAPALRTIGQVQSEGHARLQRAAGEVPAPLREQLLVPERLHLRQGDRPELRQRRPGHADQRLRPAATTAGRPTTTSPTRFSSNWIYELPWASEQGLRRLAGQRDPDSARRPAA